MRIKKKTDPVVVMVTGEVESILSRLSDLDYKLSELYGDGESRHNLGINKVRDAIRKSHKILSGYTDGLWDIGKS